MPDQPLPRLGSPSAGATLHTLSHRGQISPYLPLKGHRLANVEVPLASHPHTLILKSYPQNPYFQSKDQQTRPHRPKLAQCLLLSNMQTENSYIIKFLGGGNQSNISWHIKDTCKVNLGAQLKQRHLPS